MADNEFAVWTEENFDAEVLKQPGLTVVDFWSENCVPCKQLTRVLAQLATEIPASVRIGTVKVNDNPELAERFGCEHRRHCCSSRTAGWWRREPASIVGRSSRNWLKCTRKRAAPLL